MPICIATPLYRLLWWVSSCAVLVWSGESLAQAVTYPATQIDSVVEDLHGTRVADPYRWLEDLESPRTAEWVGEEGRLTFDYLGHLPERDAIRLRLAELGSYRRTGVPWREGRHLFFEENTGLQQQPVLLMLERSDQTPRIVLDPQAISLDGSNAISDFAASPDGRWIAYSSSPGGADVGETHVRELATGRERDVVRGTWSSVCWAYDGGGFFYMRPPARKPDEAPTASRIAKQLFYHRMGLPQDQDRLIHEWSDARWLYAMLSDDGRRVIVVMERGPHSWMYTMDLRKASAPEVADSLVPLLGEVSARHTPMGTVGHTLYVFTDLGAPRGRVIALDLRKGANARPETVIAEATDVIQGATVAGNRLAVHYLHDVTSRLSMFTLRGRPAGDVALPGIGALGWALNGRHSAPELWYSFRSFLFPETVYRYDLRSGASRAFRAPPARLDPGAYETRQVFYPSKDGTLIPMFITAKKALKRDGTNPTFLTAYGGYGMTMGPDYRHDLPLWLDRGGIYAVANIRGGGEYGEAWHRAGSLDRKQSSFDDFIAAAEYLIAQRYTRPERLAIYGHSNGGLLVGAVMTQRPELFAVALANAGHYDMLRFQKFTVGAGWIPEYGTSDNASDFGYLLAYSPLHNVHQGTCYPATLLLTGDHDDRVVPCHSYKFAAALQAAQGCEHPILLRVAGDASHSYASASGENAELSDLWAFVAFHLGLRVSSAAASH